MNKTNKISVRTDLAVEACELLSKEETYKGIETEMKRTDGIEITTVRITNDNAAEAVGKPKGTYISIEADKMKGADADYRNNSRYAQNGSEFRQREKYSRGCSRQQIYHIGFFGT